MLTPETLASVQSAVADLAEKLKEAGAKSYIAGEKLASKVNADQQLETANSELASAKDAVRVSKESLDAAYQVLISPN